MHARLFSKRERFSKGFIAGLGSGVMASILMLLVSSTLGGISLPDILGSTITSLMPPATFQSLHEVIGADAKYYLFYIILSGQCLVFALIGGSSNLLLGAGRFTQVRDEQGQLTWPVALMLALILWLFVGLIFLPLNKAGVFGTQLNIGIANTMLSLAIIGLTFSLLFVYLQNALVQRHLQKQGIEADASRRELLHKGIITIGLGTLGVLAWRFITSTGTSGTVANVASSSSLLQKFKSKISPPPTPNYGNFPVVPHLSPEVTPNDQYYLVSKNISFDPVVNAKTWSLQVYGQVEQPYTLNYTQLLALPMKQQYESMMCISNEVGGEYMSSAQWEGIMLKDLLERAGGTKAGATKVVLHAADDYSDSIHLTKALEPTTLVAVRMNGVPLPNGHGFPARLLVPGIYGMKHVKWITGVEVLKTDYMGYWQQRGWSDPAPIRMTTRIDTPLNGTTLSAKQPTYIAGIAFSGNKGISEIDVSTDNGQTWQTAILKRPLSNLTWVLWEIPWQPEAGTYTVLARTIDMEGNVQDPQEAPPQPDGSSGYHTITITVA